MGRATIDGMFMLCSNLKKFMDFGSHAVSLIHNERARLTAAVFNALATTLVAAGGFAPLAAMVYGLSDLRIETVDVVAITVSCFGRDAFLH